MNPIFKRFALICSVIILYGCNDKSPHIVKKIDYSPNYVFFPIQDGREWIYDVETLDSANGATTLITERGRYSKDSQCINFYKGDTLRSMLYWSNYENKMGCCVDVVLLNYDYLDCKSDSVLIYQKMTLNVDQKIHQFCNKIFATEVPNYDKIACVKTHQLNVFESGKTLSITNYFGFGVGLIYRQQTEKDKSGKILTQETRKLISHNF